LGLSFQASHCWLTIRPIPQEVEASTYMLRSRGGPLDLIGQETLGMDNVFCHQRRSMIMELGAKRQVKESLLKVEMKVEREVSQE
jgi:hypothetical protein